MRQVLKRMDKEELRELIDQIYKRMTEIDQEELSKREAELLKLENIDKTRGPGNIVRCSREAVYIKRLNEMKQQTPPQPPTIVKVKEGKCFI